MNKGKTAEKNSRGTYTNKQIDRRDLIIRAIYSTPGATELLTPNLVRMMQDAMVRAGLVN